MKILYLHQYFKTPSEPGGTRSYWVAKELISRGHNVTFITSSEKSEAKFTIKEIEGMKVIYLKVSYDNSMGITRRFLAFLQFMFSSTWHAFKIKDIELVIATSTPLTIGFPALVLKIFKRVPFIFEVRDLWPEVPIQMGGLKNQYLIRIAKWFEIKIYKNAKHIIALSPGMAEGVLSAGISQDKITMIPNMAKIDEFWPRGTNTSLTTALGLKTNSFKLIHFGALGIANGASTIIESAKLLKENEDIELIFLGGGATEDSLQKICNDYGLNNVHFLGKFSMKDTSEIVNLCDASIISFLDLPILYTNSPNKLFDSLSAGKPIVVNSAGWTKDLVENANCGEYVNPNKPIELADLLIRWKNSPNLLKEYSRNARKLAETKYDKSILCKDYINIIESKIW